MKKKKWKERELLPLPSGAAENFRKNPSLEISGRFYCQSKKKKKAIQATVSSSLWE